MGRGGPQPAYQVRPGDLQLDGAAVDLEDPDATPIVSQPLNNEAVSMEAVEEGDDDNNNQNILPKDVDDEESSEGGLVGYREADGVRLTSLCSRSNENNSCLEKTEPCPRSPSGCKVNYPMIEFKLFGLSRTNVEKAIQCCQRKGMAPVKNDPNPSRNKSKNNNSNLENIDDDSTESKDNKDGTRDVSNENERRLEIKIQHGTEGIRVNLDTGSPMKTILKENRDTEIQARRKIDRKVTINLMPIQDSNSEPVDVDGGYSSHWGLKEERRKDSSILIEKLEQEFDHVEAHTKSKSRKDEIPKQGTDWETAEEIKKKETDEKSRLVGMDTCVGKLQGVEVESKSKVQVVGQENLDAKIDVMDFVPAAKLEDGTLGENRSLAPASSNLDDIDHTTLADLGSQLTSFIGSWNGEKDGMSLDIEENATLAELGGTLSPGGKGSVQQLNSIASLPQDEEKQTSVIARDDTDRVVSEATHESGHCEGICEQMSKVKPKQKAATADNGGGATLESFCDNDPKDMYIPAVFTASSEFDVGTFFLQHQSLDKFDLHKVQAGPASHAALHAMGALDTKSEYECGKLKSLMGKSFKGDIDKDVCCDRFSQIVKKPPSGGQRQRSRSRSRASQGSGQSEADATSACPNAVDKETLGSRSQMGGLRKSLSHASSTGDATYVSYSMQGSSSQLPVPGSKIGIDSESHPATVASETDKKLSASLGFPSKTFPIVGTITEEGSFEDSQDLPPPSGKVVKFSNDILKDAKKDFKGALSGIHKKQMIQNTRGEHMLPETRPDHFPKVRDSRTFEGTDVQLSSKTTGLAQISSLDRGSEDETNGDTKEGTLKNISSLHASGLSSRSLSSLDKSGNTCDILVESSSLKEVNEISISKSDHVTSPAKNVQNEQPVIIPDKGKLSKQISNESVKRVSCHFTSSVQTCARHATVENWILRNDQERSKTGGSVSSSIVGYKIGKPRHIYARPSHSDNTLTPSIHYNSEITELESSLSARNLALVNVGRGNHPESILCASTLFKGSPKAICQKHPKSHMPKRSVSVCASRQTDSEEGLPLSYSTVTPSIHHSCAVSLASLPNTREKKLPLTFSETVHQLSRDDNKPYPQVQHTNLNSTAKSNGGRIRQKSAMSQCKQHDARTVGSSIPEVDSESTVLSERQLPSKNMELLIPKFNHESLPAPAVNLYKVSEQTFQKENGRESTEIYLSQVDAIPDGFSKASRASNMERQTASFSEYSCSPSIHYNSLTLGTFSKKISGDLLPQTPLASTGCQNDVKLTKPNVDTKPQRNPSVDYKISVGIQNSLVSFENSKEFTVSKNNVSSSIQNTCYHFEERPETLARKCPSVAIQCSFDQQLDSQNFSRSLMFADLDSSSASTTISSVILDRQSGTGNSLSNRTHYDNQTVPEKHTHQCSRLSVLGGNPASQEISSIGLEAKDQWLYSQDEQNGKVSIGLNPKTESTLLPSENQDTINNTESMFSPSYHCSTVNVGTTSTRPAGKGNFVFRGNQCQPLNTQHKNMEPESQILESGCKHYSISSTCRFPWKRSVSLESVISRSIQCQSLGLSSVPSNRSSARTRSDHGLYRQPWGISDSTKLFAPPIISKVGPKLSQDASSLDYITMVSESVQSERLSSRSPKSLHKTRAIEDTFGLPTLEEGTLSEGIATNLTDMNSLARQTNQGLAQTSSAIANRQPLQPCLLHRQVGRESLQPQISDDVRKSFRDSTWMLNDNETGKLLSARLVPPVQTYHKELAISSSPSARSILSQDISGGQQGRHSLEQEEVTLTNTKRSRECKISSTVSFMDPMIVEKNKPLTCQTSKVVPQTDRAKFKSTQATGLQQNLPSQLGNQPFMRDSQPLPGIQRVTTPRFSYEDPMLTPFSSTPADNTVTKQHRMQSTITQRGTIKRAIETTPINDTDVVSSSYKDLVSQSVDKLSLLPNRLEDKGFLACLDETFLKAEADAHPEENYFLDDDDLSLSFGKMAPKKWSEVDGSGDVYVTTGLESPDRQSSLLETEGGMAEKENYLQANLEGNKFASERLMSAGIEQTERFSLNLEKKESGDRKKPVRDSNASDDFQKSKKGSVKDGGESSKTETETKAGGDKRRKHRSGDIPTARKGSGKKKPSEGDEGKLPKKLNWKKLDRPSLFPGKVLAESHYYPSSNVINVLVKPVDVDVNKDNLKMQVQIHRRQPAPQTLPSLCARMSQKQVARKMLFRRHGKGLKPTPMLARNIIDLRAANPPFDTSLDAESTRRYKWMYRNHPDL